MKRVIGLVILVLGLSSAAASAQDRPGAAPVAPKLRFSLEGAAGFQVYYSGSMQSIAVGFAPTRSLTFLVSAQRSYVADKIKFYEDGYFSERGGTGQFVSFEVRYAFLPGKRLSPYVVGGTGRGILRPNVNELFPDMKKRGVQVIYYGGGVRIPVWPRLDAFVDGRLLMAVESKTDYFGVQFPIRAGVAVRF